MATWWKKFKYSKQHKVFLFICICIASVLVGQSQIGLEKVPQIDNYYDTGEYQTNIMEKAGFVRDWIVRYADQDIFNPAQVTDDEIAKYLGLELVTSKEAEHSASSLSYKIDRQTLDKITQEEREQAIAGIIKDRKEYFETIKTNLDVPNIEYFAVNKETGQVVTNRSDYNGTNSVEIITDFRQKAHYVKGNGDKALLYEKGEVQVDYYGGLENYYYDYDYGKGVDYTDRYEVYVTLKDELVPGDVFYTGKMNIERVLAIKERVYVGYIVALVILIVCGIPWMSIVGQEEKGGKVVLKPLDKVPFEGQLVFAMLFLGINCFSIKMVLDKVLPNDWLPYGASPFEVGELVFDLLLIWGSSMILLVLSSLIRHIKNGSWRQFIGIIRLGRWLIRNVKDETLPILALSVSLGYILLSGVCFFVFRTGHGAASFIALLSFLGLTVGITLILLKGIVDYRKIALGIKQVALGNVKTKVELKNSIPAMKETANAFNHIGEGLDHAIEEALKSERFKTELITNVSHDLKTPLTSIISYIELLKEETIDSRVVREYIAILDERSHRLKQLVEDLVDASKAATGNIQVERAVTRLDQLVIQSVGEYTDRLEVQHLTSIFSKIEEVSVAVDSRHMCRVMENLLSNICKYAMPNTRVYIDVYTLQEKVYIAIKNIAKEPLSVEAEELLKRFVRGDASRPTEGSGLGLAIAKSLVEVQGGMLSLEADGDLFKVIIAFPL